MSEKVLGLPYDETAVAGWIAERRAARRTRILIIVAVTVGLVAAVMCGYASATYMVLGGVGSE